MEKDVKAGLICLVVTLFVIFCIIIAANVSSSDNKDSKTTKVSFVTKTSPLSLPTTTTIQRINRYTNNECTCNEQNSRLEKCLNDLSNVTRYGTTTTTKEPIVNSEIQNYRCQSNMDCVGHEGYTECLNGYCSCKEKKLHPDQNWKYIKAYGECMVCPDGWESDDLLYSEYCFKYFKEEKTFYEALDTCKSYDSEMITVDTVFEWQAYQRYLGLYKQSHENIWLGYRSATNTITQLLFLNVHTNEEFNAHDDKWCYDGAYRTLPKNTTTYCVESGTRECDRFVSATVCLKKNAFICIKRFSDRCKSNEFWYPNGKVCYRAINIEGNRCTDRRRCNYNLGLVCLNRICKCKRGTHWSNGKCV